MGLIAEELCRQAITVLIARDFFFQHSATHYIVADSGIILALDPLRQQDG